MNACVYVIDDDPTATQFACGVAASGGFETSVYPSAEAFLSIADPSMRGCVVLDLHMEGMHGLELQAELPRRDVLLPVIIVSGNAEVSSAVQAMKQQAFDFFEKPVDPSRLLSAIRRAVEFDRELAARHQEEKEARKCYQTLSPREREVMELVVSGLPNKLVASRLGLSEKTIEVHRGNVMRKMQVESLAALVKASLVCGAPAGHSTGSEALSSPSPRA